MPNFEMRRRVVRRSRGRVVVRFGVAMDDGWYGSREEAAAVVEDSE